MEQILVLLKRILSRRVSSSLQPAYHYSLALLGALVYRFPSRKLKVVAVTGTKGKSSVCELVNAVLEEAGYKTALASTIRFKIGKESKPNLFKMTMPGRLFVQNFLRQAVEQKCDWAVLEMTSEGARQFRHKFISLDALIFTNLAPEHIESHGSYEKYLAAKLELARGLKKSSKKYRVVVANADDKEGGKFLSARVERSLPFSLSDAAPHHATDAGISLRWKDTTIYSPLKGTFNMYNILAAAAFAESQNIKPATVKVALEKVVLIPGRGEEINEGQDFTVVVDYAHTPESLTEIYKAYAGKRLICVLGATGGGRDKWKRPKLGEIADKFCTETILTDEDPYEEDPRAIVDDVARGFKTHTPSIVMDRAQAISAAILRARTTDVILITGKGTDPYLMAAHGKKIPWSDADIARAALKKSRKT